MRTIIQTCALVGAFSLSLSAQTDRVPSGTEITVRTNETVDAKYPTDSRIYSGVVDKDVMDNSGRVVIPRGSDAELIMRDVDENAIVLDLESINVNGRRYMVDTEAQVIQGSEDRKQGVGSNKRTGQYVGGGALIGGIIGAIAGGGKGAAIGAATGAGAGAVGQTVTRGGNIRLPAESLITFRLDRAMRVGTAHDSYEREGRHYHRYERNERSRVR